MNKENVVKAASLVLAATCAGTPLISSVGAAPDHKEVVGASASSMPGAEIAGVSLEGTVGVRMAGAEEVVALEDTMTFDEVLAQCLTALEVKIPEDGIYCVDFVGDDHARHTIRVGEAKADEVMSIQTLLDFYKQVSAQKDACELIVYTAEAGEELARIGCELDAEKILYMDKTDAVQEGDMNIRVCVNEGLKAITAKPGENVHVVVTLQNPKEDAIQAVEGQMILPKGLELVSSSVLTDNYVATSDAAPAKVEFIATSNAIKMIPAAVEQGAGTAAAVVAQLEKEESVSFELILKVSEDLAEACQLKTLVDVKSGLEFVVHQTSRDVKINVDVPVTKYTVSFDVDGGVAMKSLVIPKGTKLVATDLNNPVKDGFEFVQWLDAEGNPFKEVIVNSNVVLTAEWKAVEAPDPSNPSDPSEPSDPSDPSEPSDPSDPSEPSDPSDPSEPSDPSDPSEPSDPSDPSEPSDPSDPSEPSDPSNPSEPSDPSVPSEPSDPSVPSEPGEPTDPSEPSNPEKPDDMTKYMLKVTSPDGKKHEVTLTGRVSLHSLMNVLSGKSGMEDLSDVKMFGVKVEDAEEKSLEMSDTVADVVELVQTGKAVVVAYGEDDKVLGEADVGFVEDHMYTVVMRRAGQKPVESTDPSVPSEPSNPSKSEESEEKPTKPTTPAKPEKPAEKPAVVRYILNIISPDGKKQEVSLSGTKTVRELVKALSAKPELVNLKNAESYTIKTNSVKSTKFDGNNTIEEVIKVTGDGNEALVIAYDKDGTAMGSAKISHTDKNTYAVTLSKSTDVKLGKSPYTGDDEGKGKGEGVVPPIETSDALPIYGGMTGLMGLMSAAIAVLKKKFLQ